MNVFYLSFAKEQKAGTGVLLVHTAALAMGQSTAPWEEPDGICWHNAWVWFQII